MSVKAWTFVFVGGSFLLYLLIAWWSRVRDTRGFYVAGREVPAAANGMATAADWMSAASFLSMAGMVATMGYSGSVYLLGWTGGFVLLALGLAPYLRKFGHYTVPDFVGDRYDSQVARLVAVVCALLVSFLYVAAQMRGVGVVFSRFLEVDITVGVLIGMAIVFVYATLGGMRGITWTQVAQYWVLITAFLLPAFAISFKLTGQILPQLGWGGSLRPEYSGGSAVPLLERLNATLEELGFASYTAAFVGAWDMWNVFLVAASLMVGTAGLPHVIVRFYTVRTVQAARWSGFWALVFIALLYLTAPATAAFSRYLLLTTLNDRSGSELPGWFRNWERTGLILWLDDGDGKVRFSNRKDNEIFRCGRLTAVELAEIRAEHQRWLDSGGSDGTDGRAVLRARGLSGPDNDIILLATSEMAQLSGWIVALVAAGGLAAALSTASGLLLVISSSVAHDLYFRVLRPTASEKERLQVGRASIAVAVVVAGILGIYPPAFVSEVVAFAFSLAAASFFPAIVLGIFSKRVSAVPVIVGMVVGILFCGGYITLCSFLKMAPQTFGIFPYPVNPQGIGILGMVLNFGVTLVLTPFFPAPRREIQQLVDTVREPEDPIAPRQSSTVLH